MKATEKKTENLLEGEKSSPSFSTRQQLQAELNKTRTWKSRTLAWIVIGGILVISGFIFLWMSYKKNVLGVKVFASHSMEFIACLVCLIAGGSALIVGITTTLLSTRKIKILIEQIHNLD